MQIRPHILALTLLSVAVSGGCSAFNEHREDLRALRDAGDLATAEAALQEERVQDLYDDNSELLRRMELGGIRLLRGDHAASFTDLDQADELDRALREAELGEALSGFFFGENTTKYRPPAHESMYINVLKMVNQFAMGRVDGGATVEARRMAMKANLLRDERLELLGQIDEVDLREIGIRDEQNDDQEDMSAEGNGHLEFDNTNGDFIESPLGIYLSATAFMVAGDRGNQEVASRRLQQALSLQSSLIGPVDETVFQSLASMDRADVNGLVIALSGKSPTLRPFRLGPIFVYKAPVYFELPLIHPTRTPIVDAQVVVTPINSDRPEVVARLDLIENMSRVAQANYERELPIIYTRTLLRAAAKSAALTTANIAVYNATDSPWIRAAAAIAGLVLLAHTEPADLRGWLFLPGQAHVGLLNLAPGTYDLSIEYLDAHGSVIWRSPPQRLEFGESSFTTCVGAAWR